ncbi:metabolite traffic protein EboE [Nonomuraea rosea]|uniref:Metabolite traffic protein EboE n=1 Tax=Nonomuraea rosea TaxID=638574 RepID=A0ABP6YT40_9ACTN
MRFRHPDGTLVHLAYCTNVHPAEDLDGVITQLQVYAAAVRERLGVPRLGVGLWLGRGVVTRLVANPDDVRRLRRALDDLRLEVVTFNGFPYEGFHAETVKKRVYHPDWTTDDRLRHTLDLARLLAELLPEDVQTGSVSTLPLAWRTPWSAERASQAAARLERLEQGLAQLAVRTGKTIRIGFEPEPGCVVENTAQAVRLLPGRTEHLGICLDTCHLAVAFETADAVAELSAAGLPVVKVQASCALQADQPARADQRRALAAFTEPRFLHQTREEGVEAGADDLSLALGGELPGIRPWRVHFHVPVHAEPAPPLRATQQVLIGALDALLGGSQALTSHVEVETYTWEVLPAAPTGAHELVGGIASELTWMRDLLIDLGLKEDT